MRTIEPEGFIASTSRADVGYKVERAEERKRIAISRAVVRRSISAVGGRVFAVLTIFGPPAYMNFRD